MMLILCVCGLVSHLLTQNARINDYIIYSRPRTFCYFLLNLPFGTRDVKSICQLRCQLTSRKLVDFTSSRCDSKKQLQVAKSTRSTRVKIDSFVEDNAKTNGNITQTTTNTMMMVGRMSAVDRRISKISRTYQQTISFLLPLEPMSCLYVRLIVDGSLFNIR